MISAADFAAPPIEYRPGVRWWWPGNAAKTEDLIAQLDYLHDNGFGVVEIAPFSKSFWTDEDNSSINPHIYDALGKGYDEEAVLGYESPEYFDKLEAVIKHANELGIIVDLNIGSGYLANDDSVAVEDSQSNLALGRATVRVSDDGIEVVSGDIEASRGDGDSTLGIPAVEASPFYTSEKFGFDFGEWSPEDIVREAVVVAPVAGAGDELTKNNQVLTNDRTELKTYDTIVQLDLAEATVLYPSESEGTVSVNLENGDYEVIGLYSLPSGSFGLNSIIQNAGTGERNRVVDHLDPEAITNLIHGWLGNERLQRIVRENDVRAGFNDSYEFYTEAFYNDRVQNSATSEEILGYDITRFVPSMYTFFGESFLIDGAPTVKEEYSALGMQNWQGGGFGPSGPGMIASTLSEDEAERVEYDYGRLVNEAFLSGMGAFSDALGDFGMVYRQQAYNPPVDTLKSADLVDIPETEGLNEYSLKQVSSGAHLYDKNLVTSEVYTLGSTPFTVTPDFIKQGYDLMATSGVNNFFYHGLSATYFGSDELSSDDNLFAEEGWRAWPTIGVEMAETNLMHEYFGEMNAYAARANYLMQSGDASGDVAMYMPLFGGLSETDAVAALQSRGVQWDAINDDTIQNSLEWDGAQLIANDGALSFDALIVDSRSVPVETMRALVALKDAGAPIRIVGEAPSSQPSYADGEYAALDSEVSALAEQLGVSTAPSDIVNEVLAGAPISFEQNTSVRSARRVLDDGAELAYLRNTSTEESTTVAVTIADRFGACYWLDPSTGKIHGASADDSVTLTPAGAVALLCAPTENALAATDLSGGLPSGFVSEALPVAVALQDVTLTVKADNIGKSVPGEQETRTYEGEGVFGSWASDEVADGELKYVADSGTYRGTVEVANGDALEGESAFIDLGEVHDAVTIRVNPGTDHEFEQQIYSTPFRAEVSDALMEGTNVIEIEVQPVANNRRFGLAEAYRADPVANVAYQSYPDFHGGGELMPAGLLGPVVLELPAGADVPVVDPSDPTDPTDPTDPAGPDAGSGDDGAVRGADDGDLATTGGSIAIGVLMLAAVLLAGGAILVRVRRRAALAGVEGDGDA